MERYREYDLTGNDTGKVFFAKQKKERYLHMDYTNSTLTDGRIRKSGVELLKVIAIFLIVISHVTQTLSTSWNHIDYQDYVILLENVPRVGSGKKVRDVGRGR